MPNQHKATKTTIPVRLERDEIRQLKKEARRRGISLAELLRQIATGEIPLGDAKDIVR